MFNPSKDDVRRFFCRSWQKALAHEPLSPLEAIAVTWIGDHPEYHGLLSDEERAVHEDFGIEQGQSNPFLHLSMHLSIEEQISINQPAGIQDAFQRLASRLGDRHAAMHEIMDCLGEALWTAQRNGVGLDGQAYLQAILRKASP